MEAAVTEPTVLVPVDARDPGEPSASLIELLGPHSVVVLGYYQVPDQSTTAQLEEQFGDEARAATESVADRFAEHGAKLTTEVLFTHDRSTTIDTVAAEYAVDAVLTTGLIEGGLDRVLVPLRGEDNLKRIVGIVSVLLRESDAAATVLNVAGDEDEAARGEMLVRGVCDQLQEDGVDPDRAEWRQERASDVGSAIVSAAEAFDLMIVGETEPSIRQRIIGGITRDLIDRSPTPVLVIRNR